MKMRKWKELFGVFWFICTKALRKSPVLFVSSNFLGCLAGILIGLQTTVMAVFFNIIADTNASGHSGIYMWGGILGTVLLLNEVVNGVMNYAYECLERKSVAEFKGMLHDKMSRISPVDYERPEFLDMVEKASKGATDATKFISEVTMLFTTYIPYLIYMGVYLFFTNHILCLSLLSIFVPVVVNQYIKGKIYSNAENCAAAERRKKEYYRSCIYDMEYIKETRLLHKTFFFLKKFEASLKTLLRLEQDAERRADCQEAVMAGITLAGYGGVLSLLIYSLLCREIAVGDFAAIFASVGMMYGIMCEIVEGRIGSISRNFGVVQNFIRFVNTPEGFFEKNGGERADGEENAAIVLKEVCFRYPEACEDVLHKIDLTVKSGETVAIVGENGAGKSTLMKVMMGLYQPSAGSVLTGGEDIADTDCFDGVSAVFQQYQKYQMNVADNVMISDPRKGKPKNEEVYTVEEALEQVGMPPADDAVFPEGLNTILSRQFGGKELSGGQWQRIAIARGIYRERGILFLDEPTAAIDPLEESDLYYQFEKMCRKKTAVIVTHRMGCARIADRIVVLHKGMIVEAGTHEELYHARGYYRKYWDAQAVQML